MILSYQNVKEILDKLVIIKSWVDFIKQISNEELKESYFYNYKILKTKLIQNITQSHEIRFGDALEFLFEKYFEAKGFTLYPKRFRNNENREYSIDQLFGKENTLFMIEQKVRDDHDSTKKVGQFNNFENKYYELTQQYPDHTIIPIMWFIDNSLRKNRRYYQSEMEKMADDYGCQNYLFYGDEIFAENGGIQDFSIDIWTEVLEYLQIWKNTLPDMPEVNFDLNANQVFEEIKDLQPNIFRRIFGNQEVVEQIFPIIFPTGETLHLLKDYFHTKEVRVYENLAEDIEKILLPYRS